MLNIASKNKSNGRGFPLIFPTATKRKKKKFELNTLRISLPFLISCYYFNFFTFSNPLTMNSEYMLHFITVSLYIAMYHYALLCTTMYHHYVGHMRMEVETVVIYMQVKGCQSC